MYLATLHRRVIKYSMIIKNNYAAALFDEGHYMQVEVAARLKNSSQPELAKQFLQFMLTPEFQNTLPTTNWMYPVIDTPLPEVYNVLPVPKKSLQFSAQEVAKRTSVMGPFYGNPPSVVN
ncbi:Thiamine-binding periplasmic protein precursor [Providencia stuartii]|nr:Thiamine-binding periplasmic protein precursor [Providencia stuartii]